ncbi:hypothetical protein [Mesorhizobium sophorae]|uniref:hypothetical protein n=1 Tax=Mesorhizobium sophorae TaxID=1300294 RepID=UPI000BA4DD73|nr:hypothetical protein [Mesorhizobium sophorae]
MQVASNVLIALRPGPSAADRHGSWWEIELSGSWDFSTSSMVFANVEHQHAFEGDSDDVGLAG